MRRVTGYYDGSDGAVTPAAADTQSWTPETRAVVRHGEQQPPANSALQF